MWRRIKSVVTKRTEECIMKIKFNKNDNIEYITSPDEIQSNIMNNNHTQNS